jgi:hypothetical protein
MAKLGERLDEYILAANTGLWVTTYEPEEALVELAAVCQQRGWVLLMT